MKERLKNSIGAKSVENGVRLIIIIIRLKREDRRKEKGGNCEGGNK